MNLKARQGIKRIFYSGLSLFFIFSIHSKLLAGTLLEKDFKKDFAYYLKTSKAKNLGANDRLYILDVLRKKYSQAEFDLSDLYAEVDRWTSIKQKQKKKPILIGAMGGPFTEKISKKIEEFNIPVYQSVITWITAAGSLAKWHRIKESLK